MKLLSEFGNSLRYSQAMLAGEVIILGSLGVVVGAVNGRGFVRQLFIS